MFVLNIQRIKDSFSPKVRLFTIQQYGVGEEGCFSSVKAVRFPSETAGLMPKYKDDMEFRLKVTKLAELSFVPVADFLYSVYESLATITFLVDELALLHFHGTTCSLGYLSEDEEYTTYSHIKCGISRNAVVLDQPGQRTVWRHITTHLVPASLLMKTVEQLESPQSTSPIAEAQRSRSGPRRGEGLN